MCIQLDYFREYSPGGKLYATCDGAPEEAKIKYYLYNNDKIEAKKIVHGNELAIFTLPYASSYRLLARIYLSDESQSELWSGDIITPEEYGLLAPPSVEIKSLKGNIELIHDKEKYFEIKFYDGGLKCLQAEKQLVVPVYSLVRRYLEMIPVYSKQTLKSMIKKSAVFADLRNLYRINVNLNDQDMLELAKELETLDYVEYCSIVGKYAYTEPYVADNEYPPLQKDQAPNAVTPNLTAYQGYLDATGQGMNIRQVWRQNVSGQGINVRMQDTGYFNNHEDLIGNITLVTNSAVERDHGTSSAGCVAATNNGFGVNGIAYNCRLFAYSNGLDNLDLIIRDILPGDVLTISLGLWAGGLTIPLVHNISWWDRLNRIARSGAVVVIGAANGGLDLFRQTNLFHDHGDSGVILACASSSTTGRRLGFSNFNFRRVLNTWGENVVTTGMGNFVNLGFPNRAYTNTYNGTSASTPLIAGVIILIQERARWYHVVFNTDQIYKIIMATGNREGEIEGIGARPDASAALAYVDNLLGFGGPVPPPLPPTAPPLPPVRYPAWVIGRRYVVGDRVSYLGNSYQCTQSHDSFAGREPSVAI